MHLPPAKISGDYAAAAAALALPRFGAARDVRFAAAFDAAAGAFAFGAGAAFTGTFLAATLFLAGISPAPQTVSKQEWNELAARDEYI